MAKTSMWFGFTVNVEQETYEVLENIDDVLYRDFGSYELSAYDPHIGTNVEGKSLKYEMELCIELSSENRTVIDLYAINEINEKYEAMIEDINEYLTQNDYMIIEQPHQLVIKIDTFNS
jgi:hypothetical protein